MDAEGRRILREAMQARLAPWHVALTNPATAQDRVLDSLLTGYRQTEYGRSHGAEQVGSYRDFTKAFPVTTYEGFKPLIDRVLAGNTSALLSEEPVAMAFTKGTTGASKLIPWTPSQTRMLSEWYARVVHSYSVEHQDVDWMSGYRLNLVPSSELGKIKVGARELNHGFSLAIAMRFLIPPEGLGDRVSPSRVEMDALPKEPSRTNWEVRYELVYQQARTVNVTNMINTPNVVVGLGRYLHRAHGVYPKDLWNMRFYMSGGFPGTYTRFARSIKSMYGAALQIREGFVGTEGCYGAQLDDKKAWSPMYDQLLFEVSTIGGVKQLHEMYPGEIGCLIISTPDFPRYRVGDLILAFEAPYYRCIGRENARLSPYAFGNLVGKSAIKSMSLERPVFR